MHATGDRLVDAYLTARVASVGAKATRAQAFALLAERDVSSLPVTDDGGRVVGIVSLTDLLRVPGLPSSPIAEVMHSPVVAVQPGSTLRDAAKAMIDRHIHRVLVTKGTSELVGVLSVRDVMRAIAQDRIEDPLSSVMTRDPVTIDVGDPLSLGIDLLVRSKMHGVLVTERGAPVGLFTQAEALRSATMPAMAAIETFMSHAVLMLQKETPAHRAAGFAIDMKARRIVAMDGAKIAGIATGIDLLRLVA